MSNAVSGGQSTCQVILMAQTCFEQGLIDFFYNSVSQPTVESKSTDSRIERLTDAFFRQPNLLPIEVLYRFLVDKTPRNQWQRYALQDFLTLCIYKSLPPTWIEPLSAIFNCTTNASVAHVGSNDKVFIGYHLIAGFLNAVSVDNNGRLKLLGGTVILEYNTYAWNSSLKGRARELVIPWGEPPLLGAIQSTPLDDFLDGMLVGLFGQNPKDDRTREARVKAVSDQINIRLQDIPDFDLPQQFIVALLPESNHQLIADLKEYLPKLPIVICPSDDADVICSIKTTMQLINDLL